MDIIIFTAVAIVRAVFGAFGLNFFIGFVSGLSLIFAIGAQNAFVLKQGLKKQSVFLVCTICAVSDAILISLGVSGFGVLVQRFPIIEQIARFGGATFLTVYGIMNLYSAYTKSHSLNPEGSTPESALKIALLCLGFTLLNPHVYLDTVVLLGSISTQFSDNIDAFTLGAISASFVFFYALGYGSRILIPLFQKPRAWKVFEAIIGLIMIILAIGLLW